MKGITKNQEKVTLLSSYMSKQLKGYFGRGPKTCFAAHSEQGVIFYIKSFMSPLEESLIQREEVRLAKAARKSIMRGLLPSIKEMVDKTYNKKVQTIIDDWNYVNNTGVLICFWRKNGTEDRGLIADKIKAFITERNYSMHFKLDNITVSKFSENIYIAKVAEALMPIEQLLFKKGNVELLYVRENEILQSYLNQLRYNKHLLGKGIETLFITWNYEENACYFTIILSMVEE